MSAELIFDDQLACVLGLSLDQLYEQARTANCRLQFQRRGLDVYLLRREIF
jgi:hypothetical protein